MADIRGVILDVDGTLIDSNDAHAHAWVDAFTETGIQVEYDQVRRLIGKGGDKLMPEVSGIEKDSEQGKRIADRRREIFSSRYLSTIKPLPETRQMLVRMHDAGLRLVVASSAEGEELEELLNIAGTADLVEERASSSDAEQSKPDPDIINAAIECSGMQPGELLMLGDTPYDIEAADKAGVRTVAFRSGGWQDQDLAGAIAVYQDPADLLANFDVSPFAKAET
jgi:phosphoglycolate phosphatase-like HAD superfamily hydrolase